MKVLIVYYSRGGHTRKVAKKLQALFDCHIEELIDTKDRSGVTGYVSTSKDTLLEQVTEIQPPTYDPSQYDIVILGTPVIMYRGMAPAMRTYIKKYANKLPKIAFFCTIMGTTVLSKSTLKAMQTLADQKPLLVSSFPKGLIDGFSTYFENKLKEFQRDLKRKFNDANKK